MDEDPLTVRVFIILTLGVIILGLCFAFLVSFFATFGSCFAILELCFAIKLTHSPSFFHIPTTSAGTCASVGQTAVYLVIANASPANINNVVVIVVAGSYLLIRGLVS